MRFLIRLSLCLVMTCVVASCGRTRPLLDTDVVSLRLLPGSVELYQGQVVQLIVEARLADGSLLQVEPSSELTFQPNQPQVIRILDQNRIQALDSGRIRLMAFWRGKQAIARVVVHAASLADINVEPPRLSLSSGASGQLKVTGTLSDQTQLDLTQGALGTRYVCDQPAVVGVTQDGLVFALHKGNATITVTQAELSQSVQVVVDGGQPDLEQLELVPSAASLFPGQQLTLALLAHFETGDIVDITQDPQVVYASSNPAVATISSEGLLEAKMVGQAEISAVYQTLMAVSSIQVVPDATLQEIQVSPKSTQLPPNGLVQLSVAALYSDGSQIWVTDQAEYTSSDSLVASVTQQGVIVAHQAGQTTIRVAYQGLGAVCQVEVAARILVEFWLAPSQVTLQPTQTAQLIAWGRYSDGSLVELTDQTSFVSADESVATVNSAGLIQAQAAGQSQLSARFEGFADSCQVTVADQNDLVEIRVEPDQINLEIGESVGLRVQAVYSEQSQIDVTAEAGYSVSDPNVCTVQNDGLVVALSQGAALIRASYAGFESTCDVSVQGSLMLVDVQVLPAQTTLEVQQTQQLSVLASYSDGSHEVVTDLAQYRSEHPAVVSVSGQGKIRANKPGKSVVTATYEGMSDTCQVDVLGSKPIGIRVIPDSVNLQRGQSQQLVVWIDYEDGSQEDVTAVAGYVSSDASVASVEQGLIQAHTTGSAQIDVEHLGFQNACQVTVLPPVLESIQILPQAADIGLEDQLQFQVLGFYSDGSQSDLTGADCLTTYESSDEGVLTVDGQGLARPVCVGGPVSITARNGEFWSTASITVLENSLAVVDSLDPSQVLQGQVADPITVWGSGFLNASVVQVDGRDLVTSRLGPGQLSALLDGQTTSEAGIHSLTVRNPAPGGGVSLSRELWVIASPQVDSVTPSMGLAGRSIRVGMYGKGLLGCAVTCDNPGIHVFQVRYSPLGTYLFVTLTIDQSAALGLARINLSNIAGEAVADFTVLADDVFPDCIVESGEVLVASGVYTCNDVVVETGALIIGTGLEPLQVLATGTVTILGDVQVSGFAGADGYYNPAQGGAAGPGGAGGGGAGDGDLDGYPVAAGGLGSPPGQAGQGDQGAGTPSGAGGGVGAGAGIAGGCGQAGGGGGFGGQGGSGGGDAGIGSGGVGGSVNVQGSGFNGGTGGGGGSSCGANSGGGGGGGGGVLVIATTGGPVTIKGAISSDGGKGGDGFAATGGGGGGSGGRLVITSAGGSIVVEDTLSAKGGVGGRSDAGDGGGGGGGGRILIDAGGGGVEDSLGFYDVRGGAWGDSRDNGYAGVVGQVGVVDVRP